MCLHTGYKEYATLEACKVFCLEDSQRDPQYIFKGEDFYADAVFLKRFQPLRCGGTKQKNLPSVSIKLAQLLLTRTVVKDRLIVHNMKKVKKAVLTITILLKVKI